MKKPNVILVGIVLVFAATFVLHAQLASVLRQAFSTNVNSQSVSADDLEVMLLGVEQTTPTVADSVPQSGTFYSLQNPNWPPLPGNINNLPAWNLGNGTWLLADQDFDYAALEQENEAMHTMARAMGLEMDSEETGSNFMFDTNGLWLDLTNVLNGLAHLNLRHATNYVYEIWGKRDLTAFNWDIETEVFPGTNLDVMPFTVPQLERTNLFIWARDWTGITSGGNETPEWWFWKYFHSVSLSDTDLDSTGDNTLLYDYQNDNDPNAILFTLQFINNSFTANPVCGSVSLQAGVPAYEAVLINDLNWTDAVWQPFVSTNVAVDLSNGLCSVAVGLRGLPADAQQTWKVAQVTLNSNPLALTVTNPASGTVSEPLIQLQGYASKPLSSLTYDVSNALNVITNQQGYWAAQFYDTNLLMFTTNYFQCYDVALSYGQNAITLHAVDLAGNGATAYFTLTLDYSGDTNPPTMNVVWPKDGTIIASSNFTLQAQVDDATAKIVVSMNGKTNMGLVERSGTVWVNGLPLLEGTNELTLIATDVAGNNSTTNLTLVKSAVNVTVDPISADQGNQSYVIITGTVSDPTAVIKVNGVIASVEGDGTWTAENIPVSPTGLANLDVETFDASNNPTGSTVSNPSRPAMVVLAAYEQMSGIDYGNGGGGSSTVQWNYASGGNWGEISYESPGGGGIDPPIPPDGPGYAPPVVTSHWGETFGPTWQNAEATDLFGGVSYYHTHVKTELMIVPSGSTVAQGMELYLVNASAMQFDPIVNGNGGADDTFYYPHISGGNQGNESIPPEQLLINGQPPVTSFTNDDGSIWCETIISALGGELVPLTVTTADPYYNDYTFKVQAYDLNLQLAVDANRDGNITFDAEDQTAADKPYRFWINDAQESGDVSSADNDVPGQTSANANCARNLVNGRSDQINFFPVSLSLSNALQMLPFTNGYEYHLSQADSALKFVYTSLSQGNAISYLTDLNSYGYGTKADEWLTNAATIQVLPSSTAGTMLDTNWLTMVQNNGGVGIILVEGAAGTTEPLNLEIWHKDNNGNLQKLGGVPLFLKIDGVEQMYRQINLRSGYPGQPSEPPNYPDSLCNGKQIVFIHGFSIGENDARGWNAEAFKRLYQARSRAMFTVVDWQGDETVWFDSSGKLDYYDNVKNAFLTASNFNVAVNGLPGSQKYIIAHSLGNMVVSSAIKDFGLSVNSYFVLDAAVATEAYDGDNSFLDMVNFNAFSTFDGWTNYDQTLWASDWHNLFASGDGRLGLTWVNRFGVIGNFYNFYSSGENVLKNSDGTYPDGIATVWAQHELAWVYQEMSKGNLLTSLTSSGSQAGWELNTYWYVLPDGAPPGGNKFPRRRYQANLSDFTDKTDTSGHINTNSLPANPFFEVFNDSQVMDASAGSAEAAKFDVRADILGGGIPALSHATGANSVSAFGAENIRNFDMSAHGPGGQNPGFETGWPQERLNIQRLNNRWLHSDFEEIAYPFVHKLYDKLVELEN